MSSVQCSSVWRSVALAAMSLTISACASEETPPRLEALASDVTYEGRTLEQWAVEYARWFYAATDCAALPSNDVTGELCDHYQDPQAPVFFFDRSVFTTGKATMVERTQCRVPIDKAILVPVASFMGDQAGMEEPIMPNEEIEATVDETMRSMRGLKLIADGEEYSAVTQHAVGIVRFKYHVPHTPNRYGCDESNTVSDVDVDPSFLGGYFVLFKPPTPGPHELEFTSVMTFGSRDFSFHVRYKFEVAETSAR